MQFVLPSLLLGISFIIIYVWQTSFLASYTIPLIGFFAFLFLITAFRKKTLSETPLEKRKIFFGDGLWTIFFLNTVVFLLIFATGGLTSPLFFLLYFLAFSVGFVLHPLTVFIFLVGSIGVFMPDILQNVTTEHIIKVGSLVLISPLAYFFGLQNQNQEKDEQAIRSMKQKTKNASNAISKDVKNILNGDNQSLSKDDLQNLKDIETQTDSLQKNLQ